MPMREKSNSQLGESKDIALRRLNWLYKRLKKEPIMWELYKNFIDEYQSLGYMSEVVDCEEPDITYYISHQGVYRPQNSSPPLRVVFNASQATPTGYSLNSLLLNGGILQEELFSTLCHFRTHRFAFIVDVKKMYRQILVEDSQQDLLRILWKNSDGDSIKIYKLKTVTYGTSCAPFFATRTLKQFFIDEGEKFPFATPVVMSDFYMDDCLSGSNTLDTPKELQTELIQMLACCGMELHKWCSNSPQLLSHNCVNSDYLFDSSNEVKALGLLWKPEVDCFAFRMTVDNSAKYARRTVLSVIAKTYDYLGFVGPLITKAKIFMQTVWFLNIDWNDSLPTKESKEWTQFLDSLHKVNDLDINRFVLMENLKVVELHRFSDASEKAYGAVIYI
ncbi:uncharacterized protein LOC129959383 [Argiope bruennichi]|uniref:uncharacterized protein LOC129959383 n=1 Tax=Argiope bruennichi TaxID=94029 RepID=UPI0024946C68|nr:uncharacterized protein LOC129959383 [Argiope bruennichi]